MATPPSLPVIASGDWQRDAMLGDYRYEWLNDMLVERATWVDSAPPQQLGGNHHCGTGLYLVSLLALFR